MKSNPYKATESGSLLTATRGSSPKPYAFASSITSVVFAVAAIVFWYALGATYADGQFIVDDPTARFETDINGDPYAAYDRFFIVDVWDFIVLHMILLALLLLVVNLLVWIVTLLKRPPQTG